MSSRFVANARRQRTEGSSAFGFTLIELLVVISIISLLVAILLPALASARDAAVDLQCKSRIRSLGVAVSAYQGDFNQWYPVDDIWQGSVHPSPWSDGPGRYRFGEQVMAYMAMPTLFDYRSTPGKNPMMCPAVTYNYVVGMTAAQINESVYTIAVAPDFLAGNYWTSVFYGYGLGPDQSWGKNYLARRHFNSGRLSDIILAGEVAGLGFNKLGYITNGAIGVLWIHRYRSNFLLADGHVEATTWDDFNSSSSGIVFFD